MITFFQNDLFFHHVYMYPISFSITQSCQCKHQVIANDISA